MRSTTLSACLGVSMGLVGCGNEAPVEHIEAQQAEVKRRSPMTMEEALDYLHTYAELGVELAYIQARARVPIEVGPLIKNGDNGGLIDLDLPLDPTLDVNQDVCGPGANPTIREAVTCTVPAGERGNRDPAKVGFSNQGREILAARFGNPNGARVMYWAQQHGHEIASTEAALQVIRNLVIKNRRWTRKILDKLDILVVVRANPDGGDPGEECFLPPIAPGTPITTETCGITRYTVDPMAGGGFLADTEEAFFGVVGRGYDMNRYHYAQLDGAIRPVETQALVGATIAFAPEYVVDMHGDGIKTACAVDLTSVVPNPYLQGLPTADCITEPDDELLGPSPVHELVNFSVVAGSSPDGSVEQLKRRTLGARLIEAVEGKGLGIGKRFTQVAIGAGVVNAGADPYEALGALRGGWESRTGEADGVGLGILSVTAGVPNIGLIPQGFDPAFLRTNVRINKVAFRESLKTFADFAEEDPDDDAGYCDIGEATGALVALPEFFFGPNPHSEVPVMLPMVPGLLPVVYFDDCQ